MLSSETIVFSSVSPRTRRRTSSDSRSSTWPHPIVRDRRGPGRSCSSGSPRPAAFSASGPSTPFQGLAVVVRRLLPALRGSGQLPQTVEEAQGVDVVHRQFGRSHLGPADQEPFGLVVHFPAGVGQLADRPSSPWTWLVGGEGLIFSAPRSRASRAVMLSPWACSGWRPRTARPRSPVRLAMADSIRTARSSPLPLARSRCLGSRSAWTIITPAIITTESGATAAKPTPTLCRRMNLPRGIRRSAARQYRLIADVPADIVGQLRHRAVAALAVLFQRLHRRPVQVAGQRLSAERGEDPFASSGRCPSMRRRRGCRFAYSASTIRRLADLRLRSSSAAAETFGMAAGYSSQGAHAAARRASRRRSPCRCRRRRVRPVFQTPCTPGSTQSPGAG